MANTSRKARKNARHERVRQNLFGTPERPRMAVFRSNKNISVQIIDDVNGTTLAAATRKLPRLLVKPSRRELLRRGSRLSHSTEADSCITVESRNWQTAQEKPA